MYVKSQVMKEELPKKYYEKLELNEFKLNSLLEITKAINNNLSIHNILKIFEYILREQLGISKLILYANDSKKWNCILHFGGKGLNKKINVEEELTHIKDITERLVRTYEKARFHLLLNTHYKKHLF